MVGAVRFELTTSCTRNKRASQATLRPEPRKEKVPVSRSECNQTFFRSLARIDVRILPGRNLRICQQGRAVDPSTGYWKTVAPTQTQSS